MRIDKIEIKNYRGFEDESFTLNPKFTVFIGDNAKGKTTVLDALSVAIGSFFRGIDVARNEIRTIKKSDIRIQMFNNDPKPQLPSSITATGSVLKKDNLTWVRKVEKFAPKLSIIGSDNIQRLSENALHKNRSGENVIFPVISYFRAGRLFTKNDNEKVPYEKKGEGIALGYTQSLTSRSSGTNFLSWYKTFVDEVMKFNLTLDRTLLEAFNNAIISMIPDQQWVKMTYSFKDDDLVGLFSTVEGKYDKLLLSQLSDGFRNIIGIAADISYRCIKINPHLGIEAIRKTPGVVLIDEIDLHLHPNWQKRVINDFKRAFPCIQFIVTTHSPFIVQSVETEELINLDRYSEEDRNSGLDDDPNKYSIEEVADKEMGVKNVERSNRFKEMQNDAKEFFDLIKSDANTVLIQAAMEKLNVLRIKYNNDPAYVALLESELPKGNA